MYVIRIKNTTKVLTNTNLYIGTFIELSSIKHIKDIIIFGKYSYATQTIKTLSSEMLKKLQLQRTDLEIIEIELKIK